MANKTLSENVNQAISDFESIKQAIINKGIDIPSGTPTSQYSDKIGEIQSGGGGSDEDFIGIIERTATSPTLPSGLTKIGDYAFYEYRTMKSIILPNGITSIGNSAFYYCLDLALTELPSELTSIGSRAFYNCTGLTEITFKGKPNSISSTAFTSCTNLKTIKVPWAEGAVSGAPFGASSATIVYNYTE